MSEKYIVGYPAIHRQERPDITKVTKCRKYNVKIKIKTTIGLDKSHSYVHCSCHTSYWKCSSMLNYCYLSGAYFVRISFVLPTVLFCNSLSYCFDGLYVRKKRFRFWKTIYRSSIYHAPCTRAVKIKVSKDKNLVIVPKGQASCVSFTIQNLVGPNSSVEDLHILRSFVETFRKFFLTNRTDRTEGLGVI